MIGCQISGSFVLTKVIVHKRGAASPMPDDKQRIFQKPELLQFFPEPDVIPEMKGSGN